MKILKYIIIVGIVLTLWITEPLWFKKSYDTPSLSNTDIFVDKQDKERKKLLQSQLAKEKALEDKFGPKPIGAYGTRVPSVLYAYWAKTLKFPDSLSEERCQPIRPSVKGWQIVCRYRAKNGSGNLQLRQDTYIIKDGVILR